MAILLKEYTRGMAIAAIMAVVIIAALGVASNRLFLSTTPTTQSSPTPSPTPATTHTKTGTKTEPLTTTVPGTTTKTTTIGPTSTTPLEYVYLEIGTCGETQIDGTVFNFAVLNQSYYAIWGCSVPSTVTFHGVSFVFPPDQLITPAGPQIKVDIGFPDGREESLTGTIIGPSQTSVRLLTESKNPQAGIELNINGEIKLLVSEIE